MKKRFVFVSGLPRSSSTLLMNVLAQNEKFHATHTSGMLDILFSVRNVFPQLVEHKAHPLPETQKRVLKAMLDAYYEDVKKPVIFDKSRGWNAYIEFIEDVMGEKAKIIVPIRNVPDILASMEKLHRNTSKVKQPPGEAENYFLFQTVAGRCEYWCRQENLVGLAYSRILDAIQRGFRDRMHFVRFEKFTSNPKQTIKEIYDFLGEEYFEHDFNNVKQITWEDDELHGYIGLHDIRPKIEPKKSDAVEILGKEIVENYSKFNLEF